MDPPTTDEIFFVADGSGGHAFASSYSEHQKNVQRWRELEKSKAAAAAKPGA